MITFAIVVAVSIVFHGILGIWANRSMRYTAIIPPLTALFFAVEAAGFGLIAQKYSFLISRRSLSAPWLLPEGKTALLVVGIVLVVASFIAHVYYEVTRTVPRYYEEEEEMNAGQRDAGSYLYRIHQWRAFYLPFFTLLTAELTGVCFSRRLYGLMTLPLAVFLLHYLFSFVFKRYETYPEHWAGEKDTERLYPPWGLELFYESRRSTGRSILLLVLYTILFSIVMEDGPDSALYILRRDFVYILIPAVLVTVVDLIACRMHKDDYILPLPCYLLRTVLMVWASFLAAADLLGVVMLLVCCVVPLLLPDAVRVRIDKTDLSDDYAPAQPEPEPSGSLYRSLVSSGGKRMTYMGGTLYDEDGNFAGAALEDADGEIITFDGNSYRDATLLDTVDDFLQDIDESGI